MCLLVGMLTFVYWQYNVVKHLLKWIRHRKQVDPPHLPGVVDEIAREFDFLRTHHKQRKKKLSGYIKKFQAATEALPDAIVILDNDDKIEWANEKADKYINVHTPQDTGQKIVNLIRYPELAGFLNDSRKGGSDSVLEIVSPCNPDLILELRLAPYGNKKHLLVARDITKIHSTKQMRKDFIANASHELRTPLTVISGYLESLEDEQDGDPESWRQQIRQMRNQAERMRRLIEDLLKLSSLETSGKVEKKEEICVHDLLHGIIDEVREMEGGNLRREISIDANEELWIIADRIQIYSAFSNLIINAVQHTPETGSINIRWYADDGAGVLEVNDTGEGIAHEHQARLTERFYRVDKGRSREKGGTGLGLAIVKHILALHDAQLEIESELGKGSTFRCRFLPEHITSRQDTRTPVLTA